MPDVHKEPHWHIEAGELAANGVELIANYNQGEGEPTVALSIIQGDESVWLDDNQVSVLKEFLKEYHP